MDTGNIIFMKFCCCFKTERKDWKNIEWAADTHHRQMHTNWPSSAVGQSISSELGFEVVHVYFAQHCFFLPLPHMLVGIQNAAATSIKKHKTLAWIREIQVHKLWTKVYSQKELTAMIIQTHLVWNIPILCSLNNVSVCVHTNHFTVEGERGVGGGGGE